MQFILGSERNGAGGYNTVALEESRIKINDFTTPLRQVRGRRDVYTFNTELRGVELALHVDVNADQWHFGMDHINARSLELFSKPDANGVHLTSGVSPCEVFAIEGNIQQPHLKKSNLGTTMPFLPVPIDLPGSISPPAVGGFKYFSSVSDEFIKCEEIYLI